MCGDDSGGIFDAMTIEGNVSFSVGSVVAKLVGNCVSFIVDCDGLADGHLVGISAGSDDGEMVGHCSVLLLALWFRLL